MDQLDLLACLKANLPGTKTLFTQSIQIMTVLILNPLIRLIIKRVVTIYQYVYVQ